MLRRTLALGSCLAAMLVATGCQDQTTAPALSPMSAASASTAELQQQSSLLESITLNRSDLRLPSSAFVADLDRADAASRAINPGDYVCSSSSPINDWINGEINNSITKERAIFFAMYNRLADLVPTYEALYFQSSATPQYFGYNGEFTKTMVKAERDVKGFWDIPSADIQVLAMHGTMLLDTARTARTYRLLGAPPAVATSYAAVVRSALLQSTTMNGGNYPFWTFNAVSFTTFGGPIPDKIVMGDGILEGYEALGFGDVAPQAIFAHEFAHQIQFQRGYQLPSSFTAPERTRYTELMADAMSAYYLTHSRGGTLRQKRVEEFLQVFYQIGDCAFTNSGHHGTPNQRLAAARFGFEVADQAQKQGHILTAAQFNALFVARYATIIAPDAH
jgi:hypothetical protein